jgi:hypothetical protein
MSQHLPTHFNDLNLLNSLTFNNRPLSVLLNAFIEGVIDDTKLAFPNLCQ